MSGEQKNAMSQKEREKFLADVKKRGQMDDEERTKLAQKLDTDFDSFLQEQVKNSKTEQKPHTPATDEDIDKLVENLKNHPAFMTEVDLSKPLSAETEALMALQYEDNAESYKDDGNKNFKIKKYRWAIANYTEGIKCNSKDRPLNAILYSNRAACQFHLGNFRSSLKDVIIARKFKPDHIKAIVRGAQCCMELKKYKEAMRWCDDGLMLSENEAILLEIRPKAEKLQRQMERDKRKEEAKERKDTAEERKLLQAIMERGITLAGLGSKARDTKLDPLLLSSLESHHPSGAKVFLNDKGHLEWPVMFMYPEHGESDFIGRFDEHANFEDHIVHMFGPLSERVPWDAEGKYSPDKVEIYFENKDVQKLFRVKQTMTLGAVLKNKKYVVYGGTPGFIILVKDSPFAKTFLERYETS